MENEHKHSTVKYETKEPLVKTPTGTDLQIGNAGHVEGFKHFLRIGVDFQHVLSVDVRHFRHVIIAPLTLLFLQLDGDTWFYREKEIIRRFCGEKKSS